MDVGVSLELIIELEVASVNEDQGNVIYWLKEKVGEKSSPGMRKSPLAAVSIPVVFPICTWLIGEVSKTFAESISY